MSDLSLHIVVPFHQRLTASADEMEVACERCYLPVLDAIEKHSSVRVALHFNGHLLDHLSRRRPELLLRLKGLVGSGRVEVLGGLFYGGAPGLLPEMDVRGQIQMMAEYWESFIGEPPQGFWLPDLAWAPELPRMLDETGLTYGFVSSTQLVGAGARPSPLGVIERGGQGTAAFVLSAGLSSTLPSSTPDEWINALMDAAAGQSIANVWLRAESLGCEPGTADWALGDNGWLSQWLDALVEAEPTVVTTLPGVTLAGAPVATPLKVRASVATELSPLAAHPNFTDWADFAGRHSELDTLCRRMLRASEKLRLSIAAMEEEGLEEEWSDVLATTQRLVFAAQSSESYWRGAHAGFTDPQVRDAVMERLCEAEMMLDTLIQGEDDWIATEEEDCDGDLAEEVFAANRYVSAWLVPAQAGAIRTLDDRGGRRNLLDVGVRRAESFFADMAQADLVGESAELRGPPKRGAGLLRLEPELPTGADNIERTGIREWLVDGDVTPDEFFSGTVDRAGQHAPGTEVLENGIDEEGDCSFTLRVRSQLRLDGVRPRVATVYKATAVPIDAPEVAIALDVELEGEGDALLAIEIPLRLGTTAPGLSVNGEPCELRQTEHPEVTSVRIEGEGAPIDIAIEPALNVWVLPVRTTVRDLGGYRAVDHGVVVVPVVRVENKASVRVTVRISDPMTEVPTGVSDASPTEPSEALVDATPTEPPETLVDATPTEPPELGSAVEAVPAEPEEEPEPG